MPFLIMEKNAAFNQEFFLLNIVIEIFAFSNQYLCIAFYNDLIITINT